MNMNLYDSGKVKGKQLGECPNEKDCGNKQREV